MFLLSSRAVVCLESEHIERSLYRHRVVCEKTSFAESDWLTWQLSTEQRHSEVLLLLFLSAFRLEPVCLPI